MRDFVIFVDSTADLGRPVRDKYDLQYIYMNYSVDGVEHPALLDWEEMSAKDFYDIMRAGKRITTTQITADNTKQVFGKVLSEGKDILYVACSSALSGSVNLAKSIAADLMRQYEGSTVLCLDTLISSLGQGSIAIEASKLRASGKTLQETFDILEKTKLTYNYCATVDSLEYLRRAGRVKASKAFFGNIFGVKPIIISDAIGQNYAFSKAKGSRNAKLEIARFITENVIEPEGQTLFISHADAIDSAEELKGEILKNNNFKDVYINYIGPIVGASVGPGTLIASFTGKEMTIIGKD